jgi:hypothetical protein
MFLLEPLLRLLEEGETAIACLDIDHGSIDAMQACLFTSARYNWDNSSICCTRYEEAVLFPDGITLLLILVPPTGILC